MMQAFDERLLAAMRDGLPLVPRPFDAIGACLGVSGAVVRKRLAGMQREGLLRRAGATVRREPLGFVASALAVWDVDDARIDGLGPKVGALDRVSHCRRAARGLPAWPYNLLVLLHGASRDEIERSVLQIHCLLADACRGYELLFTAEVTGAAEAR